MTQQLIIPYSWEYFDIWVIAEKLLMIQYNSINGCISEFYNHLFKRIKINLIKVKTILDR